MGYLDEMEKVLREKLEASDAEGIIAFVKAAVLESYRNGQKKEPKHDRGPVEVKSRSFASH